MTKQLYLQSHLSVNKCQKDVLVLRRDRRHSARLLSMLARAAVCVPATSASSEPAFTSAGHLLEAYRNYRNPGVFFFFSFFYTVQPNPRLKHRDFHFSGKMGRICSFLCEKEKTRGRASLPFNDKYLRLEKFISMFPLLSIGGEEIEKRERESALCRTPPPPQQDQRRTVFPFDLSSIVLM